jgi:hypothetical protein
MKKSYIVDNIQKYYLGGLVGEVIWTILNGKVYINFTTTTKDMVGELKFNLDLEDNEIGIYRTDPLLRLLSITNEDIQLELSKSNTGIVNKLKIKDNKFDLDYNLSDTNIIQAVPKVSEIGYDFEFKINDEFTTNFLKAHNALEKTPAFTINTSTTLQNENIVEILLGERSTYSNKVKFTELATFTKPSDILPFSALVFREIISANKGAEGIISISNKGLAKLEFKTDTTSTKYFMVRLQ